MLRPSYAVYAIASLLVPLCYWASFRPLLSMPRLVVVVFPAFWVLARATERRLLPEPLVTGAFAAGYCPFCERPIETSERAAFDSDEVS